MRPSLATWRRTVRNNGSRLAIIGFHVTAVVIVARALFLMLTASLPDHADGLWVVSFAHDFLHGLPLRGWHLPAPPLYFPELFSLLMSGALGFSVRASLLLHGVGSWLLIGGGAYWGLRLSKVPASRALHLAFLTLVLYVLLHAGSSQLQEFEYPFSHGGATLVAFLGLVYIGQLIQSGAALRSWLVALTCLAWSCASDRAVLAQFVAPALLVTLVLLTLDWAPRRRLLWAGALLLGGPALGWLLTGAIRFAIGITPAPFHPRLSWYAAWLTFWRLAEDLVQLGSERQFFALTVAASAVILIARVIEELRGRLPLSGNPTAIREMTAQAWIAFSGLAMLIATLGVVVVTHAWYGMATHRYLLPVLVLPQVLAVIVAGPTLGRWSEHSLRWLELGALFAIVLTSRRIENQTPRSRTLMLPANRVCLDSYFGEQGLHAGYAGYWPARPLMVLSHTPVTLAQVREHLQPNSWISNWFWLTRSYGPGSERPRFDFVVTTGLDEKWLALRFGPPRARRSCFGSNVWVYDRAEDFEFRNYLRTRAALSTRDDDGWWPAKESGTGVDADDEAIPAQFERVSADASHDSEGEERFLFHFARVRANLLEIESPTRQPLELSYFRAGAEIARQYASFEHDARRFLPLPANLGADGIDAVSIQSKDHVHCRVKRVALLWDPEVSGLRR